MFTYFSQVTQFFCQNIWVLNFSELFLQIKAEIIDQNLALNLIQMIIIRQISVNVLYKMTKAVINLFVKFPVLSRK